MLITRFESEKEGTTVPYPPYVGGLQRNHGFLDVRGQPHLVSKIPETQRSPALKKLLMQLAQPDSALCTLGCDLGKHEEILEPPNARCVAGGYIQVVRASYLNRVPVEYKSFADLVAAAVEDRSKDFNWELKYVLTGVQLNLDSNAAYVPSVWIWFYAKSLTHKLAAVSRESFLIALREALSDKRNTTMLMCTGRGAGSPTDRTTL